MLRLYYAAEKLQSGDYVLYYLEHFKGRIIEETEEISAREADEIDINTYMRNRGRVTEEAQRGWCTFIDDARAQFRDWLEGLGMRSPTIGDYEKADTETVNEVLVFLYGNGKPGSYLFEREGTSLVEKVGFKEAVSQLDPELTAKIKSDELAAFENENFHELVEHFLVWI